MPTSIEAVTAALHRGNGFRLNAAELRRRVAAGEVTLEQILLDPPEYIHGLLLLDAVRKYRTGARNAARSTRFIEAMGRRAMLEGVNLCVPVGRASLTSRRWVIEYCRHAPGPGRPRAR